MPNIPSLIYGNTDSSPPSRSAERLMVAVLIPCYNEEVAID